MGSAPSIPQPQPIPPPPDYADQAVRDAARRERDKSLTGSRRRSFMSGAGAGPRVVPPVAVKPLLGQ